MFLEENAKILINQASDVSVDFLFPPNKFETKPKFPSRYMLTGGLDYAELVGVRINLKGRKGDKKPHASIIIERISDKRIHVRVNFTYIADQTEGLWQPSLDLAYAICEKFLEEKKKI